jgi:hypothetical protein
VKSILLIATAGYLAVDTCAILAHTNDQSIRFYTFIAFRVCLILLLAIVSQFWNEPKKHEHEWETIDQTLVRQEQGVIGYRYILRCKVCGDIKKVNCW